MKPHTQMTEEQLLTILSGFKKKKIAVLGDVGIDRYTIGSVERISPEAPVPIVAVQKESLKLGLASNVADNVVALSGSPLLTGVIGKDRNAKDLIDMLKDRKIATQGLVPDSSRRTILKERIVGENQQMLRVDYEDTHPLGASVQKQIQSSIVKAIATADALIVEDYAKGMLNEQSIAVAVKAAKAKKIPVLIDPHVKTPVAWYSHATLLTPNKKEAETLAGLKITDQDSLVAAGRKIMSKARTESLVITLGKDGMAIFKNAKTLPTMIPTFAQEVYDVSGAGDTVISVMALVLATGSSLEEAAYISNLAAGVEVSKRGTATVSQQEIVQAFLRQRG
jgi:rfaE bifunctional protein kinase chain/domain